MGSCLYQSESFIPIYIVSTMRLGQGLTVCWSLTSFNLWKSQDHPAGRSERFCDYISIKYCEIDYWEVRRYWKICKYAKLHDFGWWIWKVFWFLFFRNMFNLVSIKSELVWKCRSECSGLDWPIIMMTPIICFMILNTWPW